MISAVDDAAFPPAGHECLVGILDDLVLAFLCFFRIFLGGLLQTFDLLVGGGAFHKVRHHRSVLIAQIISNDNTDVVKFQALGHMNVACLVDGAFACRKQFSVVQIPADSKVPVGDVVTLCIVPVCFWPVSTVTRKDPCTVSNTVLFYNDFPQFLRRINDSKIIIQSVQVVIRCLTDLQYVIKPG